MFEKLPQTMQEIEEVRTAEKDKIRKYQKEAYIDNEKDTTETILFLKEQKELTDNPVIMTALIKRLIRQAEENEKTMRQDIDMIAEIMNENIDLECEVEKLKMHGRKLLADVQRLNKENKRLRELLNKERDAK